MDNDVEGYGKKLTVVPAALNHTERQGLRSRIYGAAFFGLFALFGTLLAAEPAFGADFTGTVSGLVQLNPGDSVWSPSHLYRLTQQGDGNLVEYSMPGNKPFWSSGTSGHNGAVTQLQTDGNLVIYAPGHVAIWSTGTAGHPYSVLSVQDDANVVLYAPGHTAVWATNAQNIAGCADGSRTQAAQYAAAAEFYDPVPQVGWAEAPAVGAVGNTQYFNIELRYDPQYRCAWALGSGDGFLSDVWIDRSTDGGKTWAGHLGDRSIGTGQDSTFTGVFNDSYPYVVRACEDPLGVDSSQIRCTSWF